MWRELRTASQDQQQADEMLVDRDPGQDDTVAGRRKSFSQAALQIIVADVSMFLDNVLAVAGAAREHPLVLAFGLLLSITLMGIGANLLGRLPRSTAGWPMWV
jgi:predicted tellurium resistance membrane protein TerC